MTTADLNMTSDAAFRAIADESLKLLGTELPPAVRDGLEHIHAIARYGHDVRSGEEHSPSTA